MYTFLHSLKTIDHFFQVPTLTILLNFMNIQKSYGKTGESFKLMKGQMNIN